MERNALIVFLKDPRTGQVKTRLGSEVGFENARQLYSRFVRDILDTVSLTQNHIRIGFDPPQAGSEIEEWLGPEYEYFPQQGNDLGFRMQDAFRRTFARGFKSAVLIGTDCPDLNAPILYEAFRSLQLVDSVIGPSFDGGYYLIGFQAVTFIPAAFENITWGTSDVLSRTIAALNGAGRSLHLLPQWRDVDTSEDLKDLVRRHIGDSFRNSRTMRFLVSVPELLEGIERKEE